MRSTEWLPRLGRLLGGALLGLYLAAPAYAFTPSDSPLLSAAAVAPNLMLLVDDSGSMNNIIWASGFDSNANWPQIMYCTSDSSCSSNNRSNLDMNSGNVLLSSLSRGGCANGVYGFYYSGARYCLSLPDPVTGKATRYTSDYLSYLLINAGAAALTTLGRNYNDGTIPSDYRINVAREVSKTLVTNNKALRIGLSTFNPPSNNDSGPGGNIVRSITDLSVVPNVVTQTQANTNYNNLITSINGLGAIANTPLAEAYYEITRYFRGLAPYYNSTPSTYTSPIQYRCQKNYGVVITDGLPTYDRSFPSNDPDAAGKLPNWDGINNDGANLNGDGEGDTLYLDDIAKFAYDTDMRKTGTDAAGKSWNAAGFVTQNLNTYTVGFTAANQMLIDAANYGQGQYYQANDSAGLSAALSSALGDINSKAGSGGAGATSAATLSSTTRFFLTLYDPKDWRGTIKAFPYDANGKVNQGSLSWSTDTTLVPGNSSTTYQSFRTDTNVPITLALANYSAAQQLTLSKNLPTGITATDLINWTKGINKVGLKVRTVLLGDIINSPLAYASPTDKTAADLVADSSYTTYLNKKSAGMNANLVVGANDGFVNVLDATNGTRRYAYMPSTVLPFLYLVSDTDYKDGQSHKFLVDGQVAIYDAQFDSTWKTLALGGVGAGGKAFYALQLFDETPNNTIKALWEVRAPDTANTANDFNDLGYAYAKPVVARLASGAWVAIIANGYGSFSGVAALYVLDIKTGTLLKKIVIDPTEKDNGLSSLRLQVDSQNVVQAAYGGDLKGRMWKFDMSAASPNSWGVAFSGKPLFTAPGGVDQPITAQPLLGDHPNKGKLVYFGTGKFNETADKVSTARQAFYAIWDPVGGTGNYAETSLQTQTITGAFTSNGTEYLTTSENDVDWSTKKGWFIPLTYNNLLKGERVIYPAQMSGSRILFTTAAVDTTDPCESSGTGRLVILDAEKGKMLNYAVLDTNGDNKFTSDDQRSSGINFGNGVPNLGGLSSSADGTSQVGVVVTSDGGTTSVLFKNPVTGARRIMWRQIQ